MLLLRFFLIMIGCLHVTSVLAPTQTTVYLAAHSMDSHRLGITHIHLTRHLYFAPTCAGKMNDISTHLSQSRKQLVSG